MEQRSTLSKGPSGALALLVFINTIGVFLFVWASRHVREHHIDDIDPGWWILPPVVFAFLASIKLSLPTARRDYLSWGPLVLLAVASTSATLRWVEPDLLVTALVVYGAMAGSASCMLLRVRSDIRTRQ